MKRSNSTKPKTTAFIPDPTSFRPQIHFMEAHMRRWLLIALSFVGFSTLASAQETTLPRGMGYFFVAPGFAAGEGTPTSTWQLGGGGEYRFYKGFAAGAEIGGLGSLDDCSCGLGIFSLNGYYHIPNATRSGKLVPFLTAGYTAAGTSEWSERWVNVGGGADYWFKNRLGLRVEFRDQMDPNHSRMLHFAGARVGLVWH
jgi:hypothetical protein